MHMYMKINDLKRETGKDLEILSSHWRGKSELPYVIQFQQMKNVNPGLPHPWRVFQIQTYQPKIKNDLPHLHGI